MKEKTVSKYKGLFIFFFFIIQFLNSALFSQTNFKTAQAEGQAKVIAFNDVKARSDAVFSAQENILIKELRNIYKPAPYNYFQTYLKKNLLNNSPDFFQIVSIINEINEDNIFRVLLEGKYGLDLLYRKLEELGLPEQSSNTINSILVEINPGNINIKKHLTHLGIHLARIKNLPEKPKPGDIKKLFANDKKASVLIQVLGLDKPDKTSISYEVSVFVREQQVPITTFKFTVNAGDTQSIQEEAVEQLSGYLNRRTLKLQTVTLSGNTRILEVSDFNSTAEKLDFINYIISNTGRKYFDSAIPQAINKDSIVIKITTPDLKKWIFRLNNNPFFTLSLVSQNSNYLFARYYSKVKVKEHYVQQKTGENDFTFFYETEPNNSLNEIDIADSSVPVYGSLRNQADIDVFRINGQTFDYLEFKLTNKTVKSVSVVVLNRYKTWVKKIMSDKKNDNFILDLSTFDLTQTIYLVISHNIEARMINVGRQTPTEYMFRVN